MKEHAAKYLVPSQKQVDKLIAKLSKSLSKSQKRIREELIAASANVLLNNGVKLDDFNMHLLDVSTDLHIGVEFRPPPHPDSSDNEIRAAERVQARYRSAAFALNKLGYGLMNLRK